MNNSSHIIEKVFLEVETSNIKTANSIKDNINAFLMDELFPKLEQLFDEYNFSDTIVRFDELNINISSEKPDNLEGIKYDFESQVREKLEKHFNSEILFTDRTEFSRVILCMIEKIIVANKDTF